jgi:transcriptional regulator of acetoin/glycerol metabolism
VYLLQELARQQETVFETLAKAGGTKAGAARLLGVSRQTVYRKMKRLSAQAEKKS